MSGTTGALSMTALRLEWTLKPMMMMTFYTIITSGSIVQRNVVLIN